MIGLDDDKQVKVTVPLTPDHDFVYSIAPTLAMLALKNARKNQHGTQMKQSAKPKKPYTIAKWPDAVLSIVADKVNEDELPEIREIVKIMEMARSDEGGIGIAAPQIGISKRIILGKCKAFLPFVILNPIITKRSKQKTGLEEGCLSTGNSIIVYRHKQVVVTGYDLDWKPVKIKARGLLAACLQHEIDHLMGITLENLPEERLSK